MVKARDGQAKAKDGQPKNQQAKQGQPKENMGDGNRVADGQTDNPAARFREVNGDGSFLHLPPRQRELIQQALTGQLPPEYAAMIQQYYMNIARGRASPGATPATPAPNR